MSPRSFVGLALALVYSACATPPDEAAPRRLPNIVVLYADDLGYGDLGCYSGDSKIPTPHLDRLAREGLLCTDAHSSSGICTPSRYALLSGRHHWRSFHGIVRAFGPSVFEQGRLTMAEMLRQRGYRTACIGKWHLGWDWRAIRTDETEPDKGKGYRAEQFDWTRPVPDGPLAHGFDSYFGDDVPNFPPYTWIENDRVVAAPTVPHVARPTPSEGVHECRPGPMVEGWRLDAVMPELTRRAVAFVEQQRDAQAPFFLYFPFTSPHAPIVPADPFVGASAAGPYGDFVTQTDATVGAVLDALAANGLADDTIVVFSADNGPEHYAYPRRRNHGHNSAGGLRGLKRDVFEGGHRVPMIVRWPGVVAPGRRSDALVGQVDLMATFAAIAGAAIPAGQAEDSFDLSSLWRGEVEAVRDALVHNTYRQKWGIRRGDWLLLAQGDGTHSRVPKWVIEEEGYDTSERDVMLCQLGADLGQKRDVAPQHPEIVGELRALLTRVREHGYPRSCEEEKE